MTIQRLVVDTSALVDASDADQPSWGETFRYLEGRYPLAAPVLLGSEAGHVVHVKRAQAFGDTVQQRSEILTVLLYGVRRVAPGDGSRERSGRFAEALGLSFYDAEFLELAARDEDAFLLTQDQRLLEAAREHLGADRAADLDGAADMIADGSL